MNAPRTTRVSWAEAWRLVPSRFPPQGVFDRIAAPEDLEALYAIEAMTNARLREELTEWRPWVTRGVVLAFALGASLPLLKAKPARALRAL